MTRDPTRRKRVKGPASKREPERHERVKRFAQLERELRTNEERWQAVINNPFMGITVIDQNHRFLMTNSTFQNMVGYKDEELKELTHWTLLLTVFTVRRTGFFLKSYSKGGVIISSRLNSC